jgi:hypothetical protein
MSAEKHEWREKGWHGEKNKRLGEEAREINGGKIKRTNKYR